MLDSKVRLYLKLNLSTHISVHTLLKKKVGTIATRRTSFLNTKMLRCTGLGDGEQTGCFSLCNVCLLTFSLFLRPRNNFSLNDWGSSNHLNTPQGDKRVKVEEDPKRAEWGNTRAHLLSSGMTNKCHIHIHIVQNWNCPVLIYSLHIFLMLQRNTWPMGEM